MTPLQRALLGALTLLIPFFGAAQCENLVFNGSFESFSALPDDDCDWSLAEGWTNAATTSECNTTNGTPEYYHVNGTGIYSSLPSNYYATLQPFEGDAVMGLASHISLVPGSREYVSVALTEPLVVGNTYQLSFAITAGVPNIGGFYSDGWGALLSTGEVFQPAGSNTLLPGSADAFLIVDVVTSQDWTVVSFTFTANEAYDRVTLGNFLSDAQQTLQPFGVQPLLSIAYCFIDDVRIEPIASQPLVVGVDPVSICPGEEVTLTANASGGAGQLTYTWSTGETGAIDSVIVSPEETTVYTVEVSDCTGAVASAEVLVTVLETVSGMNLVFDLCAGSVELDATLEGALTYTWSTGETTSNITVDEAGTYTVLIDTPCDAVMGSFVVEECFPPFTVDLGGDRVQCEGDSLQIAASVIGGTAPFIYEWTPAINLNDTTVNISNAPAGVYTLTVTDANGLVESDAIELRFADPVTWPELADRVAICEGETALINAADAEVLEYDWSTGDTLSQLSIDAPGDYFVTLTALCEARTIAFEVEENDCSCDLFVPTAFTPDNDGLNELFAPSTACELERYSFVVVNRWGETVFSTDDIGQGWNGSFNGGDYYVPSGVYAWRVTAEPASDFAPERAIVLQGHVTVVR